MSLFNDISKTVEEMDNPSHELKLKKAVQEKPSVYPSNVYITPILNHTIISMVNLALDVIGMNR